MASYYVDPKTIAVEHDILLSPLGKGGFGVVSKVQSRRTGKIRARKDVYIGTGNGRTDPVALKAAQAELAMLKSLKHPCIVSFIGYGFSVPQQTLSLYMELYDMSLRKLMICFAANRQLFPRSLFAHICYQLSRALSFLHDYDDITLLHRDIKPENVLVKFRKPHGVHLPRVVLTDFGLATVKRGPHLTSTGGTREYLAPELLARMKRGRRFLHTKDTDIFAFSKTMTEVYNMTALPYWSASSNRSYKAIKRLLDNGRSSDPEKRPKAKKFKHCSESLVHKVIPHYKKD